MSKKNALSALFGLTLCGAFVSAHAETVTPLQGQSSATIQADVAACQSQAASSQTSSSQGGGRLRGAVAGAAVGATAAQVRGNQHEEAYDRVNDDVKQDYRQNQAKQTAAAGAVIGGSRQRRDERTQASAAQSASSQTYINCMSGKGYAVTP